MTRRARQRTATNRRRSGQKNVRDPSEHPLGMATDPGATERRERIAGDGGLRLPFERDETADPLEPGAKRDPTIEQARRDLTGPQQDTDRRGDAVENFDRVTGQDSTTRDERR